MGKIQDLCCVRNHYFYSVMRVIILFLAGTGLLLFPGSCRQAPSLWKVDSPGRQIRLEIFMQDHSGSNRLYYRVYIRSNDAFKEIMDPSPLGIEREDGRFHENLEWIATEELRDRKEIYTLVTGKKRNCSNTYNALHLTFRNREKQLFTVMCRAFNNGIAFRYHFPEKSNREVRVTEELTGFDFKAGNFWGYPYDTVAKYTPSYETYLTGPVPTGTPAPRNKNGWAFPLLVESEGAWMLVSEAGLDGSYGASHLHARCDRGTYRIKFAEPGEAQGYYENTSHASLPWSTPWRFIAIGHTPEAIVETTLPTDLSAPAAIEDISWIRPGRASWSWWSDSDSPQDYNRLIPFIDLAAEMGWEYSLVDANWNRMKNGDMQSLAGYANEKNVGLLLWYNSGGKHNVVTEEPRDLMDNGKIRREEFERISKLGVKGVKVDFFESDKQEIIRQYTDILEDAARFRLVVNFHGCTLPRGWRRTWPNLLSMEAVKGGECYKFDPDYPERAPSYIAALPFTRNAVGPVDYTTGGFSDHTYPHLTTYGFELALPVVLESGIMHHMDTPEKTLGLPAFAVDFLKKIPVTWDDTRYIAGYPGREVVIARKKGNTWYIGGINGEARSKDLTLDLFLTGETPEAFILIGDGPSHRSLETSRVKTKNGTVTIHLKPYGGFTGMFRSTE